jgi:adenylate cyclase
MNKKTRDRILVSFAITFSLAGLFLLSVHTGIYQILELKAVDLRFALRASQVSSAPILHIDIDDQSLASVGRWPWPRRYHALLTDILKECGARMVLWDVIFTEEFKDNPQEDAAFAASMAASGCTYLPFYFVEERGRIPPELKRLLVKDIGISPEKAAESLHTSPESLRDRIPQEKKLLLDETVREFMRQDPKITFDGLLQAMEAKYGWFLFTEDENYVQGLFAHHDLSRQFMQLFSVPIPIQGWPFAKQYRDMNVPIKSYIESIKGSGFINAESDIDGVTRKVPLLVRYGSKILPQLTIAALRDFLDVKGLQVTRDRVVLNGALVGGTRKDITIPVDDNGCMLVNWQGKWGASFKHVPYYLVLKLQEIRGQLKGLSVSAPTAPVDPVALGYLKKNEAELMQRLTQMVQGKICIVGLTATGTHDLRPVPLQENYPMVGTHSNIITTILSERFIVRKEGAVRLCIFLLTALVIGFSSLLKMWKGLLLSLGYAAGYFLVSCGLFSRFGLWIDMVGPMGISLVGFASITSFRFFTEEKEKLWIKSAFSHYLSQEVIGELLDDPSKLKLGGERRPITVFFSDIRGFTTYSESHQPEEVVAMLNELLSEQVKVVFKYGGTLDKFVGDELMCFFGAPSNRHINDHALVAVKTAVEIQAKMRELQEKWQSEKKSLLYIGIGINTGDMVVGNMGSAERMDYTVIGDNVNLGARLCSAAGKGEIIISENTYEKIADQIVAEKLEPISVKGKAKPIQIYRVNGLK